MSDFELQLNMSLFMRRLNKYFSALPDRASGDIRAISTEICFHGWPHIINAYVSAQKMWSPGRSLQDIEREFCAGMFGDKNADAMVQVYQACERRVRPECYFAFIPAWDYARVVLGTPQFSKQCRAALEAGGMVALDPKRPPGFTTAADPAALKDCLVRNLSLIGIFSEAVAKAAHTLMNAHDFTTPIKVEAARKDDGGAPRRPEGRSAIRQWDNRCRGRPPHLPRGNRQI